MLSSLQIYEEKYVTTEMILIISIKRKIYIGCNDLSIYNMVQVAYEKQLDWLKLQGPYLSDYVGPIGPLHYM